MRYTGEGCLVEVALLQPITTHLCLRSAICLELRAVHIRLVKVNIVVLLMRATRLVALRAATSPNHLNMTALHMLPICNVTGQQRQARAGVPAQHKRRDATHSEWRVDLLGIS